MVKIRKRIHDCRPSTDGGVVAGAIIGAIVFCALIVGLLYYIFSVKGHKISSFSLPKRTTNTIDVVSLQVTCWSSTSPSPACFEFLIQILSSCCSLRSTTPTLVENQRPKSTSFVQYIATFFFF